MFWSLYKHKKNYIKIYFLIFIIFFCYPSLFGQTSSNSNNHKETGNGILLIDSKETDSKMWFNARALFDAAFYQENLNRLSNGTELRYGRIGIKLSQNHGWTGTINLSLEGNDVKVEDTWVKYVTGKTSITVGNQKEPIGFEFLTSSIHTIFMERALPYLFSPGRSIGIAVSHSNSCYSLSAGLFGQDLKDHDNNDDEGFGVTGRLTIVPINKGDVVSTHLGIGATYRTPDANSENLSRIQFSSQPESKVLGTRFLNTGYINDVDNFYLMDYEFATMYGPLYVYGEFVNTTVNRSNDLDNITFQGAYLAWSWLLTGEHRQYQKNSGIFGHVTPLRSTGAFELGIRFSWADLNDINAKIYGGESKNITFGFNWYANTNVRLEVNYVLTYNDDYANGNGLLTGNDDFKFIQARLQMSI
ncbi:MAG: porin [bacterium]